MDAKPELPALTVFFAELEAIPWFANAGEPLSAEDRAKRLARWEDWPGPEEPAVAEISCRQQALYDRIMDDFAARREELGALWERIHEVVFLRAKGTVPFDSDKDAWHAPTTAVWQAAWTAGLMGLSIYLGLPISEELNEQWLWFERGRWPAGYAEEPGDDRVGRLLVL